jgi:hypothetical protein
MSSSLLFLQHFELLFSDHHTTHSEFLLKTRTANPLYVLDFPLSQLNLNLYDVDVSRSLLPSKTYYLFVWLKNKSLHARMFVPLSRKYKLLQKFSLILLPPYSLSYQLMVGHFQNSPQWSKMFPLPLQLRKSPLTEPWTCAHLLTKHTSK